MNHASSALKAIDPEMLVCMDDYIWEHPIAVKLAYASPDNALFGEQIYKNGAKLYLYRDLAKVVLAAAGRVFKATGGTLVLYDGLRVVDAQEKMVATKRVQDNPGWLEEPRLLSPPGAGGHPRGMAVDVSILTITGNVLDMGTAFDDLSERAHRDFMHSEDVVANRKILDDAMLGAASDAGIPLEALQQEWWDFRLPAEYYEGFAPLSDSDLPDHMRLMD